MEESKLTQLEIRNLISFYRSELRKLHYQFQKTQDTINELQEYMPKDGGAELTVPATIPTDTAPKEKKSKRGPGRPKKKSKRGPGRPPKKRGPGRPRKKSKRGPGRPPKKSKRGPGRPPKKSGSKKKGKRSTGGYRLSDWDKFVIAAIDNADEPIINKEIYVVAEGEYPKEKESDLKGKISRTIHKLANKRNVLKKHSYEGRGYAYTVNPNANWE